MSFVVEYLVDGEPAWRERLRSPVRCVAESEARRLMRREEVELVVVTSTDEPGVPIFALPAQERIA